MLRVLSNLVLLSGICGLCSCVSTTPSNTQTATNLHSNPDHTLQSSGPIRYQIAPGDVLNIDFFETPASSDLELYRLNYLDLLAINVAGHDRYTCEVQVRPDGKISYYEIGDLAVHGLTVQEVRKLISEHFSKIIPSAKISVFVKESRGQLSAFMGNLSSNKAGTSRTLTVSHDGYISMPLIGIMNVAGQSLEEISADIEKRYNEFFFNELVVSVNIVSSFSEKLTVVGEVTRPGVYPLYGSVHPLYGFALAGGLLDTANVKKIVILRPNADGVLFSYMVDLSADESATSGQPPFMLRARDIVVVPRSGIANANLFIEQYIQNMLPFRLGAGVTYPIVD